MTFLIFPIFRKSYIFYRQNKKSYRGKNLVTSDNHLVTNMLMFDIVYTKSALYLFLYLPMYFFIQLYIQKQLNFITKTKHNCVGIKFG